MQTLVILTSQLVCVYVSLFERAYLRVLATPWKTNTHTQRPHTRARDIPGHHPFPVLQSLKLIKHKFEHYL